MRNAAIQNRVCHPRPGAAILGLGLGRNYNDRSRGRQSQGGLIDKHEPNRFGDRAIMRAFGRAGLDGPALRGIASILSCLSAIEPCPPRQNRKRGRGRPPNRTGDIRRRRRRHRQSRALARCRMDLPATSEPETERHRPDRGGNLRSARHRWNPSRRSPPPWPSVSRQANPQTFADFPSGGAPALRPGAF